MAGDIEIAEEAAQVANETATQQAAADAAIAHDKAAQAKRKAAEISKEA